jgi:hypothetical protein
MAQYATIVAPIATAQGVSCAFPRGISSANDTACEETTPCMTPA